MSQDLVSKFETQELRKEELLVSMFGRDKGAKTEFLVVRVCVMAEGEEIMITTSMSPVISPLIFSMMMPTFLVFKRFVWQIA